MSNSPRGGIDQRGVQIQRRLIEALRNGAVLAGSCDAVDLIETHISWVLLTGDVAYKIKKAIALPFLDFSTLARRRMYCDEELRLNSHWAPNLYLDVVPVTGTCETPEFNGDGPVIEYAVRMRRFPDASRLDAQLEAGLLGVDDMTALGRVIDAGHHAAAPAQYAGADAYIAALAATVQENFTTLGESVDDNAVAELQRWSDRELVRQEPVLRQRLDCGRVRECHGDLHLANLVRLQDGIAAFDCLEFDATLRNIDVISDVAFLVMDLVSRQRTDLAWQFLNSYLELSGDYSGMAVFNLFYAYRALVRAKVAAIRLRENSGNPQHNLDELHDYLRVARPRTARLAPLIVLMHGFSGSGKTWVSSRLMRDLPAIRLRSDLERPRLGHVTAGHSGATQWKRGRYSAQATERTYDRLASLAKDLLSAGHSVVADATFLNASHRRRFRRLAGQTGARLVIVSVTGEPAELRRRIVARAVSGTDASEAGLEVLEQQMRTAEPLEPAERNCTLWVTSEPGQDIAAAVRHRAAGLAVVQPDI